MKNIDKLLFCAILLLIISVILNIYSAYEYSSLNFNSEGVTILGSITKLDYEILPREDLCMNEEYYCEKIYNEKACKLIKEVC